MAAGSAGEGAGSNTELRVGRVFKILACHLEMELAGATGKERDVDVPIR